MTAVAETRFPPPEFESGYTMPATQHPVPRSLGLEYLDVLVLAGVLGAATWVIHKKRSRRWVVGLTVFTLLYFGFYREGCVCAIGSVQNVALGLFQNGYILPLGVLAFFALPLITALFFGRTFCAAACPHGALQDLILVKPVKVPAWLDRGLEVIPFVYLGLAILFAATGSAFIICQYDPFIPIFRLSGSTTGLAIGAGFLVTGLFVGRPYCRFLCPYGALLKIAASVSKWRVRITPDTCTQCSLCADSCPFGVIRQPAAAGPAPGLLPAARRKALWLLLAWPLLLGVGLLAGGRFGEVAAGLNPDVRLALLYEDRAAGSPLDLTRLEEWELASAEKSPDQLLAAARIARRRFHVGGWIFGGWVGLVVGWHLLRAATPRQRHDFEPERSACFGCARCFEFCPQEQVRIGGAGAPIIPAGNPPALPADSSRMTVPGDGSGLKAQLAPFPLTPALSPGERGNPRLRNGKSDAHRLAAAHAALLPLPDYLRPSDSPRCPPCSRIVAAGRVVAAGGRGAGGEGNGSEEGRGDGETDVRSTGCVLVATSTGGLPEEPYYFEPFIVSSLRRCWKSLTTRLAGVPDQAGASTRGRSPTQTAAKS